MSPVNVQSISHPQSTSRSAEVECKVSPENTFQGLRTLRHLLRIQGTCAALAQAMALYSFRLYRPFANHRRNSHNSGSAAISFALVSGKNTVQFLHPAKYARPEFCLLGNLFSRLL